MKNYRHVFFDLDRTLWDFNKNSTETLREIHTNFDLASRNIIDVDHFISTYFDINEEMWRLYRQNLITKEIMRPKRFEFLLEKHQLEDKKLAAQISAYYLDVCPKKNHLVESTSEVLTHLKEEYQIHVLTNGFPESQYLKLENCKLRDFFSHVIISEEVGHKKPEEMLFKKALEIVNGHAEESIMIGDDIDVDVLGAHRVGMDQIHYNPNGIESSLKPTFEIKRLIELKEILP